MEIKEIMETLEQDNFIVRAVEYKSEDDKEKFGSSFDAMTSHNYRIIKVNGVEVKAKRVIEEYGSIVLIYNGNQASAKKEDISSFIILP